MYSTLIMRLDNIIISHICFQDQLDLMFSQLVICTSLSELAILMPLVNTASAEENYLTDGLSKIAPEKLVRGLAGIRSIKLRREILNFLNKQKIP